MSLDFKIKEKEADEHNISEAFKMKKSVKRDRYIRTTNKELQRLK